MKTSLYATLQEFEFRCFTLNSWVSKLSTGQSLLYFPPEASESANFTNFTNFANSVAKVATGNSQFLNCQLGNHSSISLPGPQKLPTSPTSPTWPTQLPLSLGSSRTQPLVLTCSLLAEVRETLDRPPLLGIMADIEVDLITSSWLTNFTIICWALLFNHPTSESLIIAVSQRVSK